MRVSARNTTLPWALQKHKSANYPPRNQQSPCVGITLLGMEDPAREFRWCDETRRPLSGWLACIEDI